MKRIIKGSRLKSPNGYSSWMALVCFALLIQVLSLLNLYVIENYNLYLASKQSTFDLSCISQIKGIIHHNTQIRLCNTNMQDLITNKEMIIDNHRVEFKDFESYIDCIYWKDAREIHLKVYYDEKGISGYEIASG